MLKSIQQNWFSNLRGDVLSAIVVALALIPEAIAFSIIAGVDPKVGLYASFAICVIIAFAGARPGMISAATGAMALLMITLVKQHGLEYLLAATLLTGVIQIVFGLFKLGDLMRFVSRSVVTGFVNALAILIFMAQLPELSGTYGSTTVYGMTALGLGLRHPGRLRRMVVCDARADALQRGPSVTPAVSRPRRVVRTRGRPANTGSSRQLPSRA